MTSTTLSIIALPKPVAKGGMSLTAAIARRRSKRVFTKQSVSVEALSQLCWAGQGVTEPHEGLRATPSAGAIYPMTLYVVLPEGVYEFEPDRHELRPHRSSDRRPALEAAAVGQPWVGTAPVCLVAATDVARMAAKYGECAEQYGLLEAGHLAQNVLLQATALGLAGVPIGAFEEETVNTVLELPARLRTFYIVAVGHPGRE